MLPGGYSLRKLGNDFILHIEASKDILFMIFLLILTGQFHRIWKQTENVTKD